VKDPKIILLTGVDGYMGWPTFLKMGKQYPDSMVLGVDNFNRRKWVEEVGSLSAVPIVSMETRMAAAKKAEYGNLEFIEGDLSKQDFVGRLIRKYRPNVILHMAAQPSAPYSHINWGKINYTQEINMSMTRNLLCAIQEEKLNQTHYIETTTTGIYGTPNLNIPEGNVLIASEDGRKQRLPFPNLASSWYHVTKGFNATNMRLMNFLIKLPVTDIRTSIVFGTDTKETKVDEAFSTRFDFDFFFGTLFNRWCSMAVCGIPLTIYGSGNQIKPFISLEDAAQSLVNAVGIKNKSGYKVFNQLTINNPIKSLAQLISHIAKKILGKEIDLDFIHNPRLEIENHDYNFANKEFLTLLGKDNVQTMEEVISEVLSRLKKHRKTLKANKNKFIQ